MQMGMRVCSLTSSLSGFIWPILWRCEGLDTFAFFRKLLRRPKITLLLQGQPMAGRSAQSFGKAQIHVSANGRAAINKPREHDAASTYVRCKCRDRYLQIL